MKVNKDAGRATADNGRYWRKKMEFEAGNFEHHCYRDKICIILTPLEHVLMMDDPLLDIIVPAILETVSERSSVQNDG